MSLRNVLVNKSLLPLVICLFTLVGCQSTMEEQEATFRQLSVTAVLDLDYALHGEIVFVKVLGGNAYGASVTVGGVPAQVSVLTGNTMEFPIPDGAPTGRQTVVLELDGKTLFDSIYVLGEDVVDREFMLVLQPGSSEADLAQTLEGLDYEIVDGPYSLGLDAGICSGDRVNISIAGMGTGRALTELAARTDGGTILNSDPQTGYSAGTTDHKLAIGATIAHLRGRSGAGSMIAVLDTGVSDHLELGNRLLTSDGYDFVDLGTTPVDDFPGGHGTPIAVLAAGSLSGVAPAAEVLPVRVCDGNGLCYSGDILAGICHSMATAERRGPGIDDLILNLSFGGDTPVEGLQEVLEFAIDNGAIVAASAGNGAAEGSPPHYPAAFDLDGMVVSAGLHASTLDELLGNWSPAWFSTRGPYIDIAAPATDLSSGSPNGLYRTDYTGTSYASALTAGALALWQQAHPELSPAQIEAGLKAAADPLPYPETVVGAGMLDVSTNP